MTTKRRATGKEKRRQSAEEPEPEEVGYGRPPKEHAIKPGEIRNPDGRRGKPRPEVDFLHGYVVVTVNGRQRKMTRDEFLDETLFREAARGSVPAIRHLERRAERRRAEKASGAHEGRLSEEEEQIVERYLEKETERRLKKRGGNTK